MPMMVTRSNSMGSGFLEGLEGVDEGHHLFLEPDGLKPFFAGTYYPPEEKAGFIKGYRGEIDLAKLGGATTVLVEITLKQHRFEDFEIFERATRKIPEIVECLATGGGIDYMLKVVISDIDAYQRLMDELLTAGIGIDRYFTYVVTRTVKSAPQPPVEVFAKPA